MGMVMKNDLEQMFRANRPEAWFVEGYGRCCLGGKSIYSAELFLKFTHPNIPLREWDGDLVFAEFLVDGKAQLALDPLYPKEVVTVKQQLEVK